MAAKINWHRYGTKLRHTVTLGIAALSVKFSPSFGEMKIVPLVRVVPRIYAQFVGLRIVRR